MVKAMIRFFNECGAPLDSGEPFEVDIVVKDTRIANRVNELILQAGDDIRIISTEED